MDNKRFSPKKYIVKNGHKCPIDRCLVSDCYANKGLTLCLITRKQPSGKFMFASFMLDRYCLGVKDAFCNCNFDEGQLQELIDRMWQNGKVEECGPVYFHNLIYAAVDFALDNGFSPPKDFALAEKILDAGYVDDGIDDVEVGENGVPLFINGPYDDVDKVIATLNKNVGEGNFKVTYLE